MHLWSCFRNNLPERHMVWVHFESFIGLLCIIVLAWHLFPLARLFFSSFKAKNDSFFMFLEGKKKEKEEKKGRKRTEKRRKEEKKGSKRQGKEGNREYVYSVGGVGLFFSKSRGPRGLAKTLASGDFTTAAARVRGSRRLHRTSARVFDSRRLRNPAVFSCFWRGKINERRAERKREKKERNVRTQAKCKY